MGMSHSCVTAVCLDQSINLFTFAVYRGGPTVPAMHTNHMGMSHSLITAESQLCVLINQPSNQSDYIPCL